MKRVKLVVAYDGTNYCGWQVQSNGLTIEEVLNKRLSELLQEPITVIGASRTDSGVHALGNVAVFDTDTRIPPDKISFALNQRLPEDIVIQQSGEVSPDFHPRKCNSRKTYEYRILNRAFQIPSQRFTSYFYFTPLDFEKMNQGARYLLGEHDFKSFSSSKTQYQDTVRTIYELELKKEGDMIILRISGDGFLYNMVRIIAGTLIKVGRGIFSPDHVEEILLSRNRKLAGAKAPARGLTLIDIQYEQKLEDYITVTNKNWEYQMIQKEIPEKKKAYVIINKCGPEDFEPLVIRLAKKEIRNGAIEVIFCDKEKERFKNGGKIGPYKFAYSHDLEIRKDANSKWYVTKDYFPLV